MIRFTLHGVHPSEWESAALRRSKVETQHHGLDWVQTEIVAVVSDKVQLRKRKRSYKFKREPLTKSSM